MHLSGCISTRTALVDPSLCNIAFVRQRFNVLPEMLKAFDAFGQTAAFKDTYLDLGRIEPTSMDGANNALPIVVRSIVHSSVSSH